MGKNEANPLKKTKNSSSIIVNNNNNNTNIIIININDNNNAIVDINDNNNVIININKKKPGADFSDNDTKKPKELPVSTTVVFKISLRCQCDGCIYEIKKAIYKIEGVVEVEVDKANDLVTVNGTMRYVYLPEKLKNKLTRRLELVQ